MESLLSTGVFRRSAASWNAVAIGSSAVWGVRAISISGITATGLKKWKPITRSGCFSPAAISVTESEEVLVARMVPAGTISSSSAKTCFFTPISSKTASITKSASA